MFRLQRSWRCLMVFLSVTPCLAVAQSVTLSPTSLSFPGQVVNTTSAAKQLTLTNGQTVPLSISSIVAGGSFAEELTTCPLSPGTLGAGSSCTISVTFTPTVVGNAGGTLTVNDDAGNSPQVATLSGTGLAPVTLTPTSLNFGNQAVGETSAVKTVTVKNNQTGALTIASIGLSGDYQIQTHTCPITPSTLGGGKSCTVSVVFAPTTTGTRTGSLTVTDNASNSPQTASLVGTGTAPVTVTPTSLSFSNVGVGGTSAAKTITLTNGQSTALTISSIIPTGDYQIQTNNCPLSPATLGAGGNCTVLVVFKPMTAGVRPGKLAFNDNAFNTPQSVNLTGTGLTVMSITVTPTAPSIPKGNTQQFTAMGNYSDGSSQNLTNSVTWTSSNSTVATISNSGGSQGLASALAQGTSTIKASFGKISGSTVLTVGAAALASIALTPGDASIALGTTQQFTATGTFTDGSTQNLTTSVDWSSSATPVAIISNSPGSQGLATSTGTGTTAVSATSGSVSGITMLTVTSPALLSIAVTPAIPSIPLGTMQQFTATGTFSDNSIQDITRSAQWASSATAVATISNIPGTEGLVSSVGAGTSTISATSGSISGTTTLTVAVAALVSLAVSPVDSCIAAGTTEQLTATGTFTDGSTKDLSSSVSWSSSNENVATVGATGLANAILSGMTTITASSGTIAGSTTLTVSPVALVSINVLPTNPTIRMGTSQQFAATGTFTDGSTQDLTGSVHWSSSSASVATISDSVPTMGLATSTEPGTTTITADSGDTIGSTTLTVTSAVLETISIVPLDPTIPLGSTQPFTATGRFSDGSLQDLTASVTWSSSSAMVAIISNSPGTQGLATSAGLGTTTITAVSGSVSSSTSLLVTTGPPVLTSISVAPASPWINMGTTQQFTATGNYSDGSAQNLTNSVSWTSSDPAVATIQSNGQFNSGLATAVAAGLTLITATYSGVSGTTTLTVSGTQLFIATPSMDMPQPDGGCLSYKSFQGGLYENCSNTVPADHHAIGRDFAAQIEPLDTNGNPSPSGKFVFTSIGMSSAQQEFAAFLAQAVRSPSVNQTTQALSNGAASNMDACDWFPAYDPPSCNSSLQNNYDRIAANLAARGLSPAQVQVAWIKNANGRVHAESRGCFPAGTLCVPLCDPMVPGCTNSPDKTDALNLEQELGNTLRAAKLRWPSLKLVFLTPRIYGGYALPTGGNPEPFAYESGFAIKWLIQAQIDQARGLGVDTVAGDLSYGVAPWIAWGPYFWADGPIPRSDGLVWCNGALTPNPPCNGQADFQSDGEHPKTVNKQVNMLMNFFLTSPYAQPWFATN